MTDGKHHADREQAPMNKFIRSDIETLLINKAELDTVQAAAVTNIVLDGIAAAIASGLTVELRGLGTFSLRERRRRKARNPRTGEAVSVPAHRVIYFKPARKLKAAVKELPEGGTSFTGE